jgi:hypothetical protein
LVDLERELEPRREESILLGHVGGPGIDVTSVQTETIAASIACPPDGDRRAPTIRLSRPGTSRAARPSRPRSSTRAFASMSEGNRPKTIRRIMGGHCSAAERGRP